MRSVEETAAREAEYVLLEVALPGRPPSSAGILLLDPANNRLHCKFRGDWEGLADPEDAEVLDALAEDLDRKSGEGGGDSLLGHLEDTLSNVIRIGERHAVSIRDAGYTLQRLYEEHVEHRERRVAKVLPFRTHVPLLALKAAAGSFGQDMESEASGWAQVPEGTRLTRESFAARIEGRSMEPRIPHGSLCLFRRNPAGSRHGKLLLIGSKSYTESGGKYTIKRYESKKVATEDGWQHERIRLIPLNPDFEAWDLDPKEFDEKYFVLGEFVAVLPEDSPIQSLEEAE